MKQLTRFAIFCHRWMGVAFCVLFLWWFVSGIFMMYWDFPAVRPQDRLARAAPVNAALIHISPVQAAAALKLLRPADQVHLAMFNGRPVYQFRSGRKPASLVFADTGEVLTQFPPDLNLRTASAWTGQPPSLVSVEKNTEPDQWTVQGNFKALRPMLKYSWPDGQQVYISGASGEVVQYSTRSSRLFAWLGAIPHWLYFTPLRTDTELWSQVVIWSSGLATLAALLGLIVGIWMFSPSQKYVHNGKPTGFPYRGQKRLHTILGLFFGIIACTWAFSGMMSMDPFPSNEPRAGRGRGGMAAAFRPGPPKLASFEKKSPQEALAEIAPFAAKDIEFSSFAGEPIYIASGADGALKLVPVRGTPMNGIPRTTLLDLIRRNSPPEGIAEIADLAKYDAYYIDRTKEKPLPVLRVRLNDADQTRYYLDPRTGRIAGTYSTRQWSERWLYHGLHSLNFPLLYNYRPAWDLVVLSLMLAGCWLCVTSVILGWQVLARKFTGTP